MKNIGIGLLMGLAISAALFGPALISIEFATPNGINIFFGDFGYHVTSAALTAWAIAIAMPMVFGSFLAVFWLGGE